MDDEKRKEKVLINRRLIQSMLHTGSLYRDYSYIIINIIIVDYSHRIRCPVFRCRCVCSEVIEYLGSLFIRKLKKLFLIFKMT